METILLMIYDGIFYVTSAVCVNQRLSIYTDEERFEQTLGTINSIKKYCPNSKIYIIDVSTEDGFEKYLQQLSDAGTDVLYLGNNPDINHFSKCGMRSQGELIALLTFLEWFEENKVDAKRVYKVSGRYQLNDNFKLGLEHENSFVFLKSISSWMSPEEQSRTGMKKFYETRLYHMDYNLLNTYKDCMIKVLDSCMKYNVNIEHAIYYAMQEQNIVELDKIGLTGNIAPSGEFKDD